MVFKFLTATFGIYFSCCCCLLNMPNTTKTHEECLKCVCLLCMNKYSKDMRVINEGHQEQIRQFMMDGYDPNDPRLPKVICGSCRLALQDYSNGKFTRLINLYDHSLLGAPHKLTRLNTICDCIVCNITHSHCGTIGGAKGSKRKSSGSPASQRPTPIKVCNCCFTELHPGRKHHCNHTSKFNNLTNIISSTPSFKMSEKIAASVIRKKASSNSATVELASPGGGHPLKLTLPSPKDSSLKQFKHDNIATIQKELNLSNRATLKLGQNMRTSTNKRNIIQPHLKSHLHSLDHRLDDFFEVKEIDFIKKDNNTIVHTPRWTVICTDVRGFITSVCEIRRYHTNDNILVKIGIDGGRGFLKMCLSVFPLISAQESHCKVFKSSGVKCIFLLAIAPEVQENYENLLKLWTSLSLHNLETEFTIATDLKLCNLLLGLQAHGATHPCCWCNSTKGNLHLEGTSRTLANLNENFWGWLDDGRKLVKAKHFDNVVHPPLLKHADHTTPILQLIPPPELHLLLGPTNTIYRGLAANWDGVEHWLRACHVEREVIHGGSFTGNSCRLLLSNIDLLSTMCPLSCLPYVSAFRSFSKVRGYLHFNFKIYLDCCCSYFSSRL